METVKKFLNGNKKVGDTLSFISLNLNNEIFTFKFNGKNYDVFRSYTMGGNLKNVPPDEIIKFSKVQNLKILKGP
jgi:hypothetical protein